VEMIVASMYYDDGNMRRKLSHFKTYDLKQRGKQTNQTAAGKTISGSLKR